MKYSIAEGIMLVTICDVSMLVATGTARAKFPFTNNLNETGVFYWKLLEQGKDTDMLTAEAKAVYGRTEEELRPGIEKFLSSLEKAGYIIPEGK